MEKRYVVRFGAQLLDTDFDGIYCVVRFRELPKFKNEERIFLIEEKAKEFMVSEKCQEIDANIQEWLVSDEGREWISKQEELPGTWCSKVQIYSRMTNNQPSM